MLLGEFLSKEWLPAIESTIRPTTFLSYRGHVERHLVPALGRVPLQQLTGAQINAFYAKLLSQGGNDGKRKISPSTVRRIHATLHRALKDAVRWNKIPGSPADAADPPRAAGGGDHEMKVWSLAELRTFLAAERESRLYPLWLTLATTGMRRGEVLGLRWEDVDLEAEEHLHPQTRVMTGYQPLLSTPKTRRGKRLVALDPATTAALKENRRRQKEERLAAGSPWKESGFVFTQEDGEPYHPERVSKLFVQAAKKAGLPRIRLHDLRHTYATLALSGGSASQDRLRAPGPCQHRHHPGLLLPLPARSFRRGRLPGGGSPRPGVGPKSGPRKCTRNVHRGIPTGMGRRFP